MSRENERRAQVRAERNWILGELFEPPVHRAARELLAIKVHRLSLVSAERMNMSAIAAKALTPDMVSEGLRLFVTSRAAVQLLASMDVEIWVVHTQTFTQSVLIAKQAPERKVELEQWFAVQVEQLSEQMFGPALNDSPPATVEHLAARVERILAEQLKIASEDFISRNFVLGENTIHNSLKHHFAGALLEHIRAFESDVASGFATVSDHSSMFNVIADLMILTRLRVAFGNLYFDADLDVSEARLIHALSEDLGDETNGVVDYLQQLVDEKLSFTAFRDRLLDRAEILSLSDTLGEELRAQLADWLDDKGLGSRGIENEDD